MLGNLPCERRPRLQDAVRRPTRESRHVRGQYLSTNPGSLLTPSGNSNAHCATDRACPTKHTPGHPARITVEQRYNNARAKSESSAMLQSAQAAHVPPIQTSSALRNTRRSCICLVNNLASRSTTASNRGCAMQTGTWESKLSNP